MVHSFDVKLITFRSNSLCHSTCAKSKQCRGHLFSNAVKVMLFISDEQYYVPVKLCRTAGTIHLFKITDTLVPDNVKLK